jgi:hypothetical protein
MDGAGRRVLWQVGCSRSFFRYALPEARATFSKLIIFNGIQLKFFSYLIHETFLSLNMLVDDFVEIRAKRIEPIIEAFLPSVSSGTLKATVADVHGQIYVWIHEAFDYHRDFIILFQSLFGVTFTEMDLRFYPITVFRHDLRSTWLTTRTDYATAPVFRIRWEASEHTTALRSADGVVQAFEADQRRPLENLGAIFIETLNSFASLSRSYIYLSEGGIQFPAVEIETLSVTQLTRILREVRARIITCQNAPQADSSI